MTKSTIDRALLVCAPFVVFVLLIAFGAWVERHRTRKAEGEVYRLIAQREFEAKVAFEHAVLEDLEQLAIIEPDRRLL